MDVWQERKEKLYHLIWKSRFEKCRCWLGFNSTTSTTTTPLAAAAATTHDETVTRNKVLLLGFKCRISKDWEQSCEHISHQIGYFSRLELFAYQKFATSVTISRPHFCTIEWFLFHSFGFVTRFDSLPFFLSSVVFFYIFWHPCCFVGMKFCVAFILRFTLFLYASMHVYFILFIFFHPNVVNMRIKWQTSMQLEAVKGITCTEPA